MGIWGNSRYLMYVIQLLFYAGIKWQDGLKKANKGLTQVNLDFRFSERTRDITTAFEKGIFRHELLDENCRRTERFIHFDALLTKKNGKWQIMLEHQKLPATKEEWLALSKALDNQLVQ